MYLYRKIFHYYKLLVFPKLNQSLNQITLHIFLDCITSVFADTEQEKQKRKKRLWRDYEREKYETLYDDRVLINRTHFAACDRSRPLYVLQVDTRYHLYLYHFPNAGMYLLVSWSVEVSSSE